MEDGYIENAESKRPRCWVSRKDQLLILQLFFGSKRTRSEISNDLCIPYSTVARCIQSFHRDDRFISDLFKPRQVDLLKWQSARGLALKYIREQNSPFNSTDIKKYIEATAKIKISHQSMLRYLKTVLHMTYRRVSSRPVYKDPSFIKLMQITFWIEYINKVTPDIVVVNIDETLFSNNTKYNYSWTIKGNPTSAETLILKDQYPSLMQ